MITLHELLHRLNKYRQRKVIERAKELIKETKKNKKEKV